MAAPDGCGQAWVSMERMSRLVTCREGSGAENAGVHRKVPAASNLASMCRLAPRLAARHWPCCYSPWQCAACAAAVHAVYSGTLRADAHLRLLIGGRQGDEDLRVNLHAALHLGAAQLSNDLVVGASHNLRRRRQGVAVWQHESVGGERERLRVHGFQALSVRPAGPLHVPGCTRPGWWAWGRRRRRGWSCLPPPGPPEWQRRPHLAPGWWATSRRGEPPRRRSWAPAEGRPRPCRRRRRGRAPVPGCGASWWVGCRVPLPAAGGGRRQRRVGAGMERFKRRSAAGPAVSDHACQCAGLAGTEGSARHMNGNAVWFEGALAAAAGCCSAPCTRKWPSRPQERRCQAAN